MSKDSIANGVAERVKRQSFLQLSAKQRSSTNLYLDTRVREPGEHIGPPHQRIVVERPSVVVFADDEPRSNFAHPCRYFIFDVGGANVVRTVAARYPPYVERQPQTLVQFHQPATVARGPIVSVRPELACPVLYPDGERYAIFFGGMTFKAHLNDQEFAYRTLVDEYGFDPANIFVLRYDGTLNSPDGTPTVWAGDGSAFRLTVTGPGTRAALQEVLGSLGGRIGPDDLVFLFTENCGDPGFPDSILNAFPDWTPYAAPDVATDLAVLPAYKSLLVLMGQCGSGGFIAPMLAHSTAARTSIACAAGPNETATVSADGLWSTFSRDWISAQAGHDPHGWPLAFDPDADGDGTVAAEEAFAYALSVNTLDSPKFGESSEAGGDITLGQSYALAWWWCLLVRPILSRYYDELPHDAFSAKLRRIIPELQKIVVPVLTKSAADLEGSVRDRVESLLSQRF